MYLALQGRVPAWNLAGLLPPDPTSPGPGGASPGAVSSAPGGLAHPLPHYSGPYGGGQGTAASSHYPHLLPQTSEAAVAAAASHHQWPPNMEVAEASAAAMHYKMDPDAMSAMYYPPIHQVSFFKRSMSGLLLYIRFFEGHRRFKCSLDRLWSYNGWLIQHASNDISTQFSLWSVDNSSQFRDLNVSLSFNWATRYFTSVPWGIVISSSRRYANHFTWRWA